MAQPPEEALQRPLEEQAGQEPQEGEFGELLRYTLPGYAGGLLLGGLLDALGFQTSAVGQWLVRTLAGEGESLLEGLYALRQRLGRRTAGMAEAYGWGKFLGMTVPWWIDGLSRLLGVDVYGVSGFYIPYFYGLSDQIGASITGLLFLRRERGSWGAALAAYFRHPVMVSGLLIILGVPLALLAARLLGFRPSTQVLTALETIAANLCWVPPLVGALAERRERRAADETVG
jgi:hypothetical protein